MFLLLFAFFSFVNSAKLPQGTVYCKRHDPNVHECVKNAVQKSLPLLIKGSPELGIESLDPFGIGKIVIDQKKGNGAPVDIDLIWEDANILGIKDITVNSASADWDNGVVAIEATIPIVDIKGRYTIDGIMLILPIRGDGNFDCKLEGFKAHVKLHGSEQVKDGVKYFMLDRLAYTFDLNHLTVKFENLFAGDPVMGDAMNAFLNENWRDILDEMKPTIEATFSQHFLEVAQKVFHQVPIDDIALP